MCVLCVVSVRKGGEVMEQIETSNFVVVIEQKTMSDNVITVFIVFIHASVVNHPRKTMDDHTHPQSPPLATS